jgi:hypothetical protein
MAAENGKTAISTSEASSSLISDDAPLLSGSPTSAPKPHVGTAPSREGSIDRSLPPSLPASASLPSSLLGETAGALATSELPNRLKALEIIMTRTQQKEAGFIIQLSDFLEYFSLERLADLNFAQRLKLETFLRHYRQLLDEYSKEYKLNPPSKKDEKTPYQTLSQRLKDDPLSPLNAELNSIIPQTIPQGINATVSFLKSIEKRNPQYFKQALLQQKDFRKFLSKLPLRGKDALPAVLFLPRYTAFTDSLTDLSSFIEYFRTTTELDRKLAVDSFLILRKTYKETKSAIEQYTITATTGDKETSPTIDIFTLDENSAVRCLKASLETMLANEIAKYSAPLINHERLAALKTHQEKLLKLKETTDFRNFVIAINQDPAFSEISTINLSAPQPATFLSNLNQLWHDFETYFKQRARVEHTARLASTLREAYSTEATFIRAIAELIQALSPDQLPGLTLAQRLKIASFLEPYRLLLDEYLEQNKFSKPIIIKDDKSPKGSIRDIVAMLEAHAKELAQPDALKIDPNLTAAVAALKRFFKWMEKRNPGYFEKGILQYEEFNAFIESLPSKALTTAKRILGRIRAEGEASDSHTSRTIAVVQRFPRYQLLLTDVGRFVKYASEDAETAYTTMASDENRAERKQAVNELKNAHQIITDAIAARGQAINAAKLIDEKREKESAGIKAAILFQDKYTHVDISRLSAKLAILCIKSSLLELLDTHICICKDELGTIPLPQATEEEEKEVKNNEAGRTKTKERLKHLEEYRRSLENYSRWEQIKHLIEYIKANPVLMKQRRKYSMLPSAFARSLQNLCEEIDKYIDERGDNLQAAEVASPPAVMAKKNSDLLPRDPTEDLLDTLFSTTRSSSLHYSSPFETKEDKGDLKRLQEATDRKKANDAVKPLPSPVKDEKSLTYATGANASIVATNQSDDSNQPLLSATASYTDSSTSTPSVGPALFMRSLRSLVTPTDSIVAYLATPSPTSSIHTTSRNSVTTDATRESKDKKSPIDPLADVDLQGSASNISPAHSETRPLLVTPLKPKHPKLNPAVHNTPGVPPQLSQPIDLAVTNDLGKTTPRQRFWSHCYNYIARPILSLLPFVALSFAITYGFSTLAKDFWFIQAPWLTFVMGAALAIILNMIMRTRSTALEIPPCKAIEATLEVQKILIHRDELEKLKKPIPPVLNKALLQHIKQLKELFTPQPHGSWRPSFVSYSSGGSDQVDDLLADQDYLALVEIQNRLIKNETPFSNNFWKNHFEKLILRMQTAKFNPDYRPPLLAETDPPPTKLAKFASKFLYLLPVLLLVFSLLAFAHILTPGSAWVGALGMPGILVFTTLLAFASWASTRFLMSNTSGGSHLELAVLFGTVLVASATFASLQLAGFALGFSSLILGLSIALSSILFIWFAYQARKHANPESAASARASNTNYASKFATVLKTFQLFGYLFLAFLTLCAEFGVILKGFGPFENMQELAESAIAAVMGGSFTPEGLAWLRAFCALIFGLANFAAFKTLQSIGLKSPANCADYQKRKALLDAMFAVLKVVFAFGLPLTVWLLKGQFTSGANLALISSFALSGIIALVLSNKIKVHGVFKAFRNKTAQLNKLLNTYFGTEPLPSKWQYFVRELVICIALLLLGLPIAHAYLNVAYDSSPMMAIFGAISATMVARIYKILSDHYNPAVAVSTHLPLPGSVAEDQKLAASMDLDERKPVVAAPVVSRSAADAAARVTLPVAMPANSSKETVKPLPKIKFFIHPNWAKRKTPATTRVAPPWASAGSVLPSIIPPLYFVASSAPCAPAGSSVFLPQPTVGNIRLLPAPAAKVAVAADATATNRPATI